MPFEENSATGSPRVTHSRLGMGGRMFRAETDYSLTLESAANRRAGSRCVLLVFSSGACVLAGASNSSPIGKYLVQYGAAPGGSGF
jgi:hypothetical protein